MPSVRKVFRLKRAAWVRDFDKGFKQGAAELNWQRLKLASLLAISPIGSYLVYYLVFVARYISSDEYPNLYGVSTGPFVLMDIGGFAVAIAIATLLLLRQSNIDEFKPSRPSFPNAVLGLIVIGVTGLVLLSIYRVLGSLQPQYVIENYALYQFHATYGGAWMILGCYAALYMLLLDMYFGGVNPRNGAAFLVAVLIVSISGGRGILILFVLTFLVLLMLQRIRLLSFALVAALSCGLMAASFLIVTDLRDTRTPEQVKQAEQRSVHSGRGTSSKDVALPKLAPTESFEDLNYNAAFILEDVLKSLKSGRVEPGPYAIRDAVTRLVPRALMPDKPVSTAETVALYPQVAQRGTNITYPLKANLMMHLGLGGFWVDWLIVALAAAIFMIGVGRRAKDPRFSGFVAILFGCAFTLVARAGILNARLLDQVLLLVLAYAGYRAVLAFAGSIEGKKRLIPRLHRLFHNGS